ncbi:hypothetical protein [Glycomyces xiaoerkulensis]|uniref:hypothetical protein n=1 Tax=Glycomyces xiaoerkulensis TaxID=2038139 RepID=UPI000C26B1D2|nr:hypothetical protein [Glycomyces xiaoerkulensis]
MSPKRPRRRSPFWRRKLDAELAAAAPWEARLDLRREILIALVAIPAGAACIGLLIWHRAFVEPLGASPVSVLLILLTAAVAIGWFWWFVLREPGRLWKTLALLIHLPLAFAPISAIDDTEAMALDERGVTEECTVESAEEYVPRSRWNNDMRVRHGMRCSTGTHDHVTSTEHRHDIGTRLQVVYDPEEMVEARVGEPEEADLGGALAVSAGILLLGLAGRIAYVWWRVRRSRRRGTARDRGR